MYFVDWLSSLLTIIPSPTSIFPGVAPGYAWVEAVRLVGLWVGVGSGVALIVVGVRGECGN